jgi:hypothetical protein
LALEKAFKAPSTVVEWEGPAKVLTSKEWTLIHSKNSSLAQK